MDSRIPDGLLAGSSVQGRSDRTYRMRLDDGGRVIDIDHMWKDGFALSRGGPQPVRGFVDLFDGTRHLFRALIYKTGETSDQQFYGFKQSRRAGLAPPIDYVANDDAPVGYLPGRAG